VRGSEWVTHCFIYPLILAFSLREKEWLRLAAKLNHVMDVIYYPAHLDNQTLTVYQAQLNGTVVTPNYLFFRLKLNKNIKPVPNNQIAAGTGTLLISGSLPYILNSYDIPGKGF